MIIEKTYYSSETSSITIVLRDNDGSMGNISSDLNSINISTYDGSFINSFSSVDYAITISSDLKTCFIVIPVNTDIDGGVEYNYFGISILELVFDEYRIKSYFYDPNEFYGYKLILSSNLNGGSFDRNIERDILMIDFLERSINDAISIGSNDDAVLFYNKARIILKAHKTIHYKNEGHK